MTSAARASARASSGTVSPYPDLHSNVVVPWRSISPASRRRFARSTASEASRVAATVPWMPPARYGRPAIRAANSALRSPAKTRWACESTKPGSTARPAASSTVAAAGARDAGPVQATWPPSMTSAASVSAAKAPASPSLVTSSPIPVISMLSGSDTGTSLPRRIAADPAEGRVSGDRPTAARA